MPFAIPSSRAALALRTIVKSCPSSSVTSSTPTARSKRNFSTIFTPHRHRKRVTAAPSLLLQHASQFHASAVSLDGKSDPYGTLGVSKTASTSEIKKSYYKLAKKYHPDVNKETGAEKRFQDIQAAYEILSDPSKKSAFDTYGAADGPGAQGSDGFNPYSNFSGGFGGFGGFGGAAGQGFDFEDLFHAFSGGRTGNAGRRRGADTVQEFRGDDIEVRFFTDSSLCCLTGANNPEYRLC